MVSETRILGMDAHGLESWVPFHWATAKAILGPSQDEPGHWTATLAVAEKGQCSHVEDRSQAGQNAIKCCIVNFFRWKQAWIIEINTQSPFLNSRWAIQNVIWATIKDRRSINPTRWLSAPPKSGILTALHSVYFCFAVCNSGATCTASFSGISNCMEERYNWKKFTEQQQFWGLCFQKMWHQGYLLHKN